MAEFNRLFQLPRDQYFEGSPILLEAGALLQETGRGRLIGQLRFRSMTDQAISGVSVDLHCADVMGAETGVVNHQYTGLGCRPFEAFGEQTPLFIDLDNTASFSVVLRGAAFADGHTWKNDAGTGFTAFPPPSRLKLEPEQLKTYQKQAGKNLVYAPERAMGLWRCGCGTINLESGPKCRACRADFAQQIALYNPETLSGIMEAEAEKRRSDAYQQAVALQDARKWSQAASAFSSLGRYRDSAQRADQCVAALHEAQEQNRREAARLAEEAAARKRRRIRTVVIVITLLALAAGAAYFITQVYLPDSNYKKAVSLMESGEYDRASKAFAALGDYRDAAGRVREPYYLKGDGLLAQGQYADAAAAFDKATGYLDAKDAASYALGMARLEDGDYTGARDAFTQVGDYADAADRIPEAWYAEGMDKLAAKDYAGARDAFTQAGDYADAADRIPEAWYAEGMDKLQSDRIYDAIAALEEAGDHADAPQKLQEAIYRRAEALREEGEYIQAYGYYRRIPDYEGVTALLAEDENMQWAAENYEVLSPFRITTIISVHKFKAIDDTRTNQYTFDLDTLEKDSTFVYGLSVVNITEGKQSVRVRAVFDDLINQNYDKNGADQLDGNSGRTCYSISSCDMLYTPGEHTVVWYVNDVPAVRKTYTVTGAGRLPNVSESLSQDAQFWACLEDGTPVVPFGNELNLFTLDTGSYALIQTVENRSNSNVEFHMVTVIDGTPLNWNNMTLKDGQRANFSISPEEAPDLFTPGDHDVRWYANGYLLGADRLTVRDVAPSP